MKQTNQCSRTGPHIPTRLRNSIETEQTGNKHQHRYSPHDAQHDAYPTMMHDQFKMQGMAWQFTSRKHYTLNEDRYATSYISTKLHD